MFSSISKDSFELKYLKYKFKYLQLKQDKFGGAIKVIDEPLSGRVIVPFKLFDINRKLREATLGSNYPKLSAKYSTWAKQLHAEGLYLPNKILEEFAKLGLIDWYILNSHGVLDIAVNYANLQLDRIDYFTFQKLFPFADSKKFPQYKSVNLGLVYETKIDFLQYWHSGHWGKIVDKYASLSFNAFLLQSIFNNNTEEMTQQFIKMKELAIEARSLLGDVKGLTDSLFLKYPIILIWGVIFNRFKIIMESFRTTNPLSHILLRGWIDGDIILFDMFTDMVQTHIYSLVKLHVEHPYKIIDVSSPFIEFTSINRDILMDPFIKNPDKIKERIDKIKDLLQIIPHIKGIDEPRLSESISGPTLITHNIEKQHLSDEQHEKIIELSPNQREMIYELIKLEMSFDEALKMAVS
jgi:hypothetical protein